MSSFKGAGARDFKLKHEISFTFYQTFNIQICLKPFKDEVNRFSYIDLNEEAVVFENTLGSVQRIIKNGKGLNYMTPKALTALENLYFQFQLHRVYT